MRRATVTDWIAAAAVLVALVAFALVKVQAIDVPWHLATARLAREIGHWPTRNTFSYTFPDYPLYQQYPLFQGAIYAVYERLGWEGLSLLACAGWAAAFLLFVRWAGPLRAAVPLHLAWMLGLYALQRRMVLRPDLFTMLALGALLLALDAYERRPRRWPLAIVPLVHLFWVNSHQLFPVSLVVQAVFVGHLVITRAAPVLPPLLALLVSAALSFATPLGADILDVTAHTAGSVSVLRDQVKELAPLWQMPHELVLALLTGVPAAWALWRSRPARAEARAYPFFDLGLWLVSLALVLSAVRGLMFFGIVSVAVVQRSAARLAAAGRSLLPAVRPSLLRVLGVASSALAVVLGLSVVAHRWVRPPLLLGGTQPGVGRCAGGWADGAIGFLARNPPPGRMMNVAWPSGNALIWGLPDQPVFVDPRFESYPRAFMRTVADSYTDDARLAALLAQYRPAWIFAEHFRDAVRARLVTLLRQGWTPVYVDSDDMVLVRDGADTETYRAAHAVDLATAEPRDLLPGPPALRAQQRARFARLMRALGFAARFTEQRDAARREAGPQALAAFDEPSP